MSRQPTGCRRSATPRVALLLLAWTVAGVGVGMGLFPGMSRAAYADDAVAILGIDAQEIGDAVGLQVTDSLRRKAVEIPGVRLVPGKDLIEMKMVFGCDGEAPACLAQAGRTLGADRLLYGSLRKADNGRSIVVSLKLLDVRDLNIVKQINEIVLRRTFSGTAISAATTRWLAQLIAMPQVGGINVTSTPTDAQVLVDNTAAGRTPLRLRDIKLGAHAVTVQLDGYVPQTHNVEVRAGANEAVTAHLEHEPVVEPTRPPPPVGIVEQPPSTRLADDAVAQKPSHPGRPAKYAALGLVGGAVIAGAVAIYTWRSYISLEGDAHRDLTPLAQPGISGDLAKFLKNPSCSSPQGAPASVSSSYLSHCDSGNKFAHATTGLWVTAGVLATAGIVSFIIGETQDRKAERERDQREGQRIQSSLRLVPALSTKGGGLQGSFEF